MTRMLVVVLLLATSACRGPPTTEPLPVGEPLVVTRLAIPRATSTISPS